jgi:hypothetical protein
MGLVSICVVFFYLCGASLAQVWVGGSSQLNIKGTYNDRGTNTIGARANSASWVDKTEGQLWVFGGEGFSNSSYGTTRTTIWTKHHLPPLHTSTHHTPHPPMHHTTALHNCTTALLHYHPSIRMSIAPISALFD